MALAPNTPIRFLAVDFADADAFDRTAEPLRLAGAAKESISCLIWMIYTPLVLVVSFLVAYLIHVLIEKPTMALRDRLRIAN